MPETVLTELAVYAARPTVRVDGQENERVTELLGAMRMDEREGGLSSLEMRFTNWVSDPNGGADFAFEDDEALRLGAAIAVYAGDVSAPQEIFRGAITGLEAELRDTDAPALVVFAEDALQRARMSRRTRLFESMTLADIAGAIAGDLGLRPQVSGLGETAGTYVQLNETDLGFLRRLIARHGGEVQVIGDELHVTPWRDVQRGRLELAMHGQLRSARVLADLTHQVTKVTVAGWDPAQGQRVTGESTESRLAIGAGRTGSAILQETLGERVEHIAHAAVLTEAEARALAEAAFDHRARRFVHVDGVAEGNPGLRVGTRVRLTGLGARFDNEYYVTAASHRYDGERGYETHFEAETPVWGRG